MSCLKPAMMKTLVALCAAFCLCVVVEAHSVRIFAAQDAGKIVGKVYFVGGGAGENVDVVIAGQGGEKLATVKTDEKGEFSFAPAAKEGEFKLSVNTGDGHSAKTSVSFGVAEAKDSAVQAQPAASAGAAQAAPAALPPAIDAKALEEIVDKSVSRRILPLQESLERYEGLIRLRDVLGGIGYIFGIAGIASFFLSRRNGKAK